MEYKVLLVDDDEPLHKLIPAFLERAMEHKFTVYSAMNGKEGIKMYSKLVSDGQKLDLVLMDLRMPVMDGVEATKGIIENDPKANIYLFTSCAETPIERDALKAGAKGTINKTSDWDRTLKNIINALEPHDKSEIDIAIEEIKEVVASVATSEDETTITMEAGEDHGLGLYLYGIADANAQTKLGEIGIEGNEVYTNPYKGKGLSAIVHNCPLEPYKSDDEKVVKDWVETHQHVLDVAEEKFGTVIPFSFGRIIKPEGENNAKEVLKRWVSEEFDGLMEKMEKIKGKKEYGVQIFYIPSVMSEKIAEETEEIGKIKKERESRMVSYFKDFYEKIGSKVEEIRVEKTKKTDEKDKQMIMNLTCLVANDKYKELVVELIGIDNEEGFSVRFTGPLPAYSFV